MHVVRAWGVTILAPHFSLKRHLETGACLHVIEAGANEIGPM